MREVVVELRHQPYGQDSHPLAREQWDTALKEMLRYDEGEVISHNPETGSLRVKVGILHGRRWESFGYRIVQVVEATGYTSRDGVYHPPQDWTSTVLFYIDHGSDF
jgi:hypothetical protein